MRAKLDGATDALAQRKKEQRRMSGGWTGGGFGVSGAIKGALTASVMNAGTKMLRGAAFGVANTYI